MDDVFQYSSTDSPQSGSDQSIDSSASVESEFLSDVIEGLSRSQKSLPCKYFYDEKGSVLFEKICETPEYYVTRSETEIYREYAAEMALQMGSHALLIEPGAGSVKKISYLLEALSQSTAYIPTDISKTFLHQSCKILRKKFPEIRIEPEAMDFSDPDSIQRVFQQAAKMVMAKKRVVFFPGSTIGNFNPIEAGHFLKGFAQHLNPGDGLLIGVDKVKDKATLERAYNDQKGITAEFNLNILARINHELGADFELDSFSHKAVFNEIENRIEMHLVSDKDQNVFIANRTIGFKQGETIHTENSYKYHPDDFITLADASGYQFKARWEDKKELFSVYYFEVRSIS